jgi:hypothetical protein
MADVIATTYSYVSKTAKSIKLSASVTYKNLTVGGAYSKDFFQMVDEQRKTNTVTTRTKYFDHRYTLLTNTRCPLDSKFIAAIGDLVFAVDMEDDDLATYLAQILIDDYGTHIVKKVKIGGEIFSDNFVDESYYNKKKETITNVQLSASISFANMISTTFDSNKTVSAQEIASFQQNIVKTVVDAVGGRYLPGMSTREWAESLDANMRAFDREADLLSNLILGSNFPMFPMATVFKANAFVQDAIKQYLGLNSIDGCLDRGSINYNPQANFNSGKMCDESLKFGGFISNSKTCIQTDFLGGCSEFGNECIQNNVLTNSATCPSGYVTKTFTSTNPSIKLSVCEGGPGINNGAVLFGGIYSSIANNPITGARSCPPNFRAQSLFDCSDNFICLSTDVNDNNIKTAVPFGGFISNCFFESPSECPQGLQKILINTIRGCQISYCSKYKDWSRPDLRRPPFVSRPPSYFKLRFNPYRRFSF